MTNTELMLAEAEYWAGYLHASYQAQHLLSHAVAPYIPKIVALEIEYGVNQDNNGYWIDDYDAFTIQKHEHRCFFALLMAAALKE